jgi:hypothetical protein
MRPGLQAKHLAMVSRARCARMVLFWDPWQEEDVIGRYPLIPLLRARTTPKGSYALRINLSKYQNKLTQDRRAARH